MQTTQEIDILVLNAHPDDSEMAMGGTLLLLASSGYKILNLCLTQGQSGTFGSIDERFKEFTEAQKFIGSEGVMWDYMDTRLERDIKITERVAGIIRTRKPKIVFAPYLRNDRASFQGMANKDHSITGHIAADAIKLARLKNALPKNTLPDSGPHTISKLFFYMVPSGTFPQMLVDVSGVIEKLQGLLACYKSQLQIPLMEERLLAARRTYGSDGKVAFAEAFVTEMPLMMTPEIMVKV